MKRLIEERLLSWKTSPHRKPLIVRGARQVGKTYTIEQFGRDHFDGSVHTIDFEKRPDWHTVFDVNLDPTRILSDLELLLNKSIRPGSDLLFFDEIQSCPRALMALRYFYEEMPDLHVIAAGSLLEFALQDISFPVGRVQFLRMDPMNFYEFLIAAGKGKLAEIILDEPQTLSATIHATLLDEVRRYFFVGGMPECVRRYTESGMIRNAFAVQMELITAFRQDFSKYAPLSDKRCLDGVLTAASQMVGRQIKYARMVDGFSNPTIKKAFELLCKAFVIRIVQAASPAGLPLGASVSPRKFKAILVDIGLMQYLTNMPVELEFARADLLSIYHGALAEQFVGQEFISAGYDALYYWAREAKSSVAEVDYLITHDGHIYPVEIKSGSTGRLRSMHLLLSNYPNCPRGFVLSTAPFSNLPEQKLTFLPLYYAYSLAAGHISID